MMFQTKCSNPSQIKMHMEQMTELLSTKNIKNIADGKADRPKVHQESIITGMQFYYRPRFGGFYNRPQALHYAHNFSFKTVAASVYSWVHSGGKVVVGVREADGASQLVSLDNCNTQTVATRRNTLTGTGKDRGRKHIILAAARSYLSYCRLKFLSAGRVAAPLCSNASRCRCC